MTPSLPVRSAAVPTTPASPPRKVVSEFKSFAASSSGMSMSSTPLGGAEDEMDSLTQSIELKFGAISLDQVSLFC